MDLTKLPPVPPPESPHDEPELPIPIDALLSLGVGVLILLFTSARRVVEYAISVLFGRSFPWGFTDPSGETIPYTQTFFFWGDLAMAVFALAVMADGFVIGSGRGRGFRRIGLAVVATAVLLNLGYLIYMLAAGNGLQIGSALATVYGGYLLLSGWASLQRDEK